jgi:hypothetical protein
LVAGLIGLLVAGCSSDGGGPGPTNTGAACSNVDQCYPGVKDGDLLGEAECLDKVTGGYCTHHCTADSDCCGAAGECPGNHAEVCAPFESTPDMYCFLSCEDDDLKAAGLTDADVYCHNYASTAFNCRSTGGGSKNRKVCMG